MLIDDLDTLWIIDTNGLCLLQQVFDDQKDLVDKSIFSGFVSALMNFSDRLLDDNLEKISMGKNDIFCVPFDNRKFFVVLASKRGADETAIVRKIHEVGEAFKIEYGIISDFQVLCEDEFEPFINTIDRIFETKTIRVIKEHDEFLKLLQSAEENNYTESQTIEAILAFFEILTETKRKMLLQTTLPVLLIFTESKNITYEQMKRFEKILTMSE